MRMLRIILASFLITGYTYSQIENTEFSITNEDELMEAISNLNKDFTKFEEIENYINNRAGRLEKRKAIKIAIKNQWVRSRSKIREHCLPFVIGYLSLMMTPVGLLLCDTPNQMAALTIAGFGAFSFGMIHYFVANRVVLAREEKLKRLYHEC